MTDEWVLFDQLCKASGLKQPSAVRKWALSQGIVCHSNAAGQPIATWTAVNAPLLKGSTLSVGPNFAALDEAAAHKNHRPKPVLPSQGRRQDRTTAARASGRGRGGTKGAVSSNTLAYATDNG